MKRHSFALASVLRIGVVSFILVAMAAHGRAASSAKHRESKRKPAQAATPSPLVELRFKDVMEHTLRHNTSVRLALLDYRIARAEAEAGSVDFDTFLSIGPSYKFDRQLANSTLENPSYTETKAAFSLGLKRKFSLGTQTELTLQELRLTSDSAQATYSERTQAAAQVKVTQPLLKGVGASATEVTLRKAELKVQRYKAELDRAINEALVKTLGLYWDLRKAQSEERLKASDADFYAEKSDEAKEKLALGLITEADGLAIQAQYDTAYAEWALARSNEEEAKEKLVRELPGAGLSLDRTWLSVDSDDEKALLETQPASAAVDFFHHPAMVSSRLRTEETRTELAKAKNSLLPQLDLSAQYATVGAGLDRSEAESGLTTLSYPAWQIKIVFKMPFGNETARGEYARLAAEEHRNEQQGLQKRSSLEREYQQVLRELEDRRQSLRLVHERLPKAKDVFEFKAAEFKLGRISSIDLIQARNDYSELQEQEQTLLSDLKKAETRRRSYVLWIEAKN